MRSNYPLYPNWIAPLFRVSGIFESAPSRWRIFFIEVEDENGRHMVDEKSLFAPTPLGDRTRFQQLMNEIENTQPGQAPKILAWVAGRLRQTDPRYSDMKTVRIIQFGVPPEAFLQCASLADVYTIANKTGLPKVIVASIDVTPSS